MRGWEDALSSPCGCCRRVCLSLDVPCTSVHSGSDGSSGAATASSSVTDLTAKMNDGAPVTAATAVSRLEAFALLPSPASGVPRPYAAALAAPVAGSFNVVDFANRLGRSKHWTARGGVSASLHRVIFDARVFTVGFVASGVASATPALAGLSPGHVFALHLVVSNKAVHGAVNDVLREWTAGRLSAPDTELWAPFLALVWQALAACPAVTAEVYRGVAASADVASVLAVVGSGPESAAADDGTVTAEAAALRDAAAVAWGGGALLTGSTNWTAVSSLAEGKTGTVFLVQPRPGGAVRDVSAFSSTPQVRGHGLGVWWCRVGPTCL